MTFPLPLSRSLIFAAACCVLATSLPAQTKDPDILIFTNGDKLAGHFVRSTGGSVTFASDMLGEIRVDWSKIKELHSAQKYAVIPKDTKISKANEATIPQGTIAVADQKIAVATTPPQAVPVANAAYVVDDATFQKVLLHNPGFLENWTGAVTGGATLVAATQQSRTFTGGIALVRATPAENWLNPRDRTTAAFTASYGTVSQPGTSTVKTSIYHGEAERDQYVSGRTFAFGQVALDHNFSQGLDLQQAWGGGIGYTLLRSARQTLDLKGSLSYVNQKFATASANQTLIGSTFSETWLRRLPRGMTLTQNLSANPAWNNSNAYSGTASAGLTLPAYKRLNVALNTIDGFINNPPPGFRRNSFQLVLGLNYALR